MNITKKIIITDTNIITDLDNADLLDKFVKLDNVYVCDMIKNNELNFKTGNKVVIAKFKVIKTDLYQVMESRDLFLKYPKITQYDFINFIAARDNNGILATGDNRLRIYAEENGVEVIRTLRIIRLMRENGVISTKDAIKACELLKGNSRTRIPSDDIDNMIKEYNEDIGVRQ